MSNARRQLLKDSQQKALSALAEHEKADQKERTSLIESIELQKPETLRRLTEKVFTGFEQTFYTGYLFPKRHKCILWKLPCHVIIVKPCYGAGVYLTSDGELIHDLHKVKRFKLSRYAHISDMVMMSDVAKPRKRLIDLSSLDTVDLVSIRRGLQDLPEL